MTDIVIIRKPGRPYASFKELRVCQTTEEGERQIGRRESDNLVVSVKAGNRLIFYLYSARTKLPWFLAIVI